MQAQRQISPQQSIKIRKQTIQDFFIYRFQTTLLGSFLQKISQIKLNKSYQDAVKEKTLKDGYNQDIENLQTLVRDCVYTYTLTKNSSDQSTHEKCLFDSSHRMKYMGKIKFYPQQDKFHYLCVPCFALINGIKQFKNYSSYERSLSYIMSKHYLNDQTNVKKAKKEQCIEMLEDLLSIVNQQNHQDTVRHIKNRYSVKQRLSKSEAIDLYKVFQSYRRKLTILKRDWILEFFFVDLAKKYENLSIQQAKILRHFAHTAQIKSLQQKIDPERQRTKPKNKKSQQKKHEDITINNKVYKNINKKQSKRKKSQKQQETHKIPQVQLTGKKKNSKQEKKALKQIQKKQSSQDKRK